MAKNSTKEKILSALAKTENYIKTQAQSVKESIKTEGDIDAENEFIEEELEFDENLNEPEFQESEIVEDIQEQQQPKKVDLSKIMIKDDVPSNPKRQEKSKTEEELEQQSVDLEFESTTDEFVNLEEIEELIEEDENFVANNEMHSDNLTEEFKNLEDEIQEQEKVVDLESNMSDTQETLLKQSLESSTDLSNVDVSLFSHEKFVSFVKEYENPVDKIKLMGKRITFLNSSIHRLQTTNSELKDRSLNLASNFENFKKDELKSIDDKVSRKIGDLFLDIIPSIDIFEMAISNEVENAELKKWLIGFKMIYNQLYGVLESNGIKKMEIVKGDKPNHNYHNQIELKKTDEIAPGLIYSVKQSGYLYKGKLLRVASVVISAPLDENSADTSSKAKANSSQKEEKSASAEKESKN